MTQEERAALVEACERAEYEYPILAAPDGTVAVDFKHLRAALDQIEADGQRIAELNAVLWEVFEEWAGSDGFIPQTAPEGYLLELVKKMALTARAALGDKR